MEKSMIGRFRTLFSQSPCNTSRQTEVDISKAVVACTLAAIHVFVLCSPDRVLDYFGVAYIFDSVLGGPMAAPLFMFSMGIGLAYSKDRSPKRLLKRGISLILMGYLLNICRYLIPSIVGYGISGEYSFYMNPLPFLFFGNDIWQFAGIAHIFMAFLLWLGMSETGTLNTGIILAALAMTMGDVNTRNDAANVILGHIVGVGDEGRIYSDFPLFIWFAIYAGGYTFGYFLLRLKDKKRFYSIVTLPFLIISITVMVLEYRFEVGMMGGSGANVFYHMTLPEILVCFCFVIGLLGVNFFLSLRLSPGTIRIFEDISRSLMAVYFIQWILVWWSVNVIIYNILGYRYFDWPYGLLLGTVLGLISVVLGIWWTKRRKTSNVGKKD